MDHYMDIQVLPDPEFGQVDLLNTLFSKLHRVLNSQTPGRVGVSFPHHGRLLGDCLRLHGALQDLLDLSEINWLQGMRDYTRITPPTPIPAAVSYRTVKRVQAKSAHNKRQRSITKGWLTPEEAQLRIPDSQQKELKLPYVELNSRSNGNRMRVYIEHGPLRPEPVTGAFGSYGLSASTTIPWF